MGLDEQAVVDGDLRVRGIDNLYVVDASVIPAITTGPINACVVAIGEQWANQVWPKELRAVTGRPLKRRDRLSHFV